MNKKLLGMTAVAAALLLGSVASEAATTVNLTAQRTTVTLPDGQIVPMWGYCGALDATATSSGTATGGTCGTQWTPGPTITVPANDSLTINLTNTLPTPTSIVILGQVGGGIGAPNKAASPGHPATNTSTLWSKGTVGGTFTPPGQASRARSFAPEADGATGSQSYTWNNLKPGTYLYQSGSRPSLQVPMGLYGVLVVTTAPTAGTSGVAYTAPGSATAQLKYDMDGTLLFSEIDAKQNAAVDAAAIAMSNAKTPSAGNADYSKLEQRVFSDPDCTTTACYPPAVNYAPTYFMINGQSFDKANPALSALILPNQPAGSVSTGNVLLRMLNAGLKTHIPTVAGLNATIVAEDGNLQPDVALSLKAGGAGAVGGKVQSSILLPAGKTTDVVVSPARDSGATQYLNAAFAVLDRQLSLSAGNKADGGMQGFVAIAPANTTAATLGTVTGVGGGTILPTALAAAANNDAYFVPANSTAFSGNVLSNDVGISQVAISAPVAGIVLNADGSFTYTATTPATLASASFQYCQVVNGAATSLCATATLTVTTPTGGPTLTGSQVFTSKVATLFKAPLPGVLARLQPTVSGSPAGWTDSSNYALYANATPDMPSQNIPAGQLVASSAPSCASVAASGTCNVTLYADGTFTATATAPGTYQFQYYAVNAQKVASSVATAQIVFPAPSNIAVTLKDSVTGATASTDYRWVIEQDDTFLHDPNNDGFVPPAYTLTVTDIRMVAGTDDQVQVTYSGASSTFPGLKAGTYVQIGGVVSATSTTNNAELAYNGVFRVNSVNGTTSFTYTLPLKPATLPGPASTGSVTTSQSLATNFHRSHMPMVAAGCTGPKSCNDAQTLNNQPAAGAPRSSPSDVALDPTKRYYLSILPGDAGDPVWSDTNPTGHSMGSAPIVAANGVWKPVTVLAPQSPLPPAQLSVIVFEDNNPVSGDVDDNEPGLGGFEITINDVRGSSGDGAGQMTYDLFNQPLTNALANTPGTGNDGVHYANLCPTTPNNAQTPVGVIYTCMPVLNAQGVDISPYTGMALVKNMIPGRLDVQAHPAAWRQGKGEKWIQVSTLEGTPNNDTFIHPGEPAYWQEFGPPGFHSFIGFLNPDHVAATNAAVLAANPSAPLVHVTGRITGLHTDRPPEAKLNDTCQSTTGDQTCARAALNYTQCYVALNATGGTGATIAFATCDENGNFTFDNVPPDNYELFIWDEWLDQIKAKKAVNVPATLTSGAIVAVGDVPVFNWFTRLQETQYLDLNGNGRRDPGEPGLGNLFNNVRFRDGSFSNVVTTDSDGIATHNELFPLFNWYVMESDQTRYKNTGTHIIYDAGGIPDQTSVPNSFFSTVGVLNSKEKFPLDLDRQIPGAKYFPGTTERIDPPSYITQGTQGFINQTQIVEWGKQPFAAGENGGISGMIYFASVRAFDDPRLKVQNLWEPGIPRIQVNLYRRTTNADGTVSDILVDTTASSSWDDWAMGSRPASKTAGMSVPNMNCPGQAPGAANPPAFTAGAEDPFVNYSLGDQNQFKCYDGQHAFNQVQPAVYDGYYAFPTGACTICSPVSLVNNSSGTPLMNPDGSDPGAIPMLPPGQYIVEAVIPPGYEITKEEDKNILIGDTWIAAAPQQFGTLENIFILPDQATLNNNNPEGFGFMTPPCAGLPHLVPDYLTVVPEAQQVAPYAGQVRPLCDKKLVTVADQVAANADFQLWTPAPVAGHISGLMLNDAAAEFDPYNPSFGEKFALPNAPVSVRDFNGVEILRAYTDKWGTFNFLNPSTWNANVPNPSGYAPNMLTYCMNDPGPVPDPANPGKFIVDPNYNPQYSDFCYNWPTLPGITTYLDTPVLPVSAFALHYAPVDCQYPDITPAIKRVDGNWAPLPAKAMLPPGTTLPTTPVGPYVDLSKTGATLTITALGDTSVLNPAYGGPTAVAGTSYASNRIVRHYGFGAAQGTAGRVQLVSSAGVATTLAIGTWADDKIVASVPATLAVGAYQLVVRAANGVDSVDTVTVTLENSGLTGYRAPWYVAAPIPATTIGTAYTPPHPIQDAIDKALPGDMIIVDAGAYPELAIMWKPLRLQGVGAASTVVQATKYPNNKIADWRSRINLLFGLDNEGNQLTTAGGAIAPAQVDPLPGQAINGGIVRLEPSALSTEEGAGITVLAANLGGNPYNTTPTNRGNNCPNLATTSPNPLANFVPATPYGFFPTSTPTAGLPANANQPIAATAATRRYSDFRCYASRIDGLSVTGSDAGGGIYVNGWAHNLEISNNRVFGNSGPYAGGVRVGQPYLDNQTPNGATGQLMYDVHVKIHNNAITTNGTDEANAAPGSPVGNSGAGGGLSINAGSDDFSVTNNWICGNFTAGDGGGVGILGNSTPGRLSNNSIIFNEAYQQTGANFGGGIAIEGEPGTATTVSTGVGNIVVDSNLIQGNSVRSGSGGGIRIAEVNGTEIRNTATGHYVVTVTNNMIVNNVAGWAGAGVSVVDSLWSVVEENTIANNDALGVAGTLMDMQVGAAKTGPATAVPNPAGIASEPTSTALQAAVATLSNGNKPTKTLISEPKLINNIVFQNRSFFFDASSGTAKLCASNRWSDAAGHNCAVLDPQPATGACMPNAAYWDLGVVGDQAPTNGGAVNGPTVLAMTYGLTTLAGNNGQYLGTGNKTAAPGTNAAPSSLFVKEYCNGGRVTPGTQFEPGTPFQPPFQLQAAATLDESGNFVDVLFGPLSLRDPGSPTTVNGNYDLKAGSPAVAGGTALGAAAPFNHDIHGTSRPGPGGWDQGADQTNFVVPPRVTLTPASHDWGAVAANTSTNFDFTLSNAAGSGTFLMPTGSITVTGTGFTRVTLNVIGNCGATLAGGASCTIRVQFRPTAVGSYAGQLAVSGTDSTLNAITVTNSPATLAGSVLGPNVTLAPTSHDFGTVNYPVAPNAGPTFDFTLTNAAGSATFTGINVTLPNGFTRVTTGVPQNCGATLAGNTICTIRVRFQPTTIGAFAGNLTVTGTNGTVTGSPAALSGNALRPLAFTATVGTVTPASGAVNPGLNFGAQTVATVSIVTVTNVSGSSVTLSAIPSVAGTGFARNAIGTTCTATTSLAANGGSCTVSVTYTPAPTASTVRNGTLTVNNNAANQVLNLTGTR